MASNIGTSASTTFAQERMSYLNDTFLVDKIIVGRSFSNTSISKDLEPNWEFILVA